MSITFIVPTWKDIPIEHSTKASKSKHIDKNIADGLDEVCYQFTLVIYVICAVLFASNQSDRSVKRYGQLKNSHTIMNPDFAI